MLQRASCIKKMPVKYQTELVAVRGRRTSRSAIVIVIERESEAFVSLVRDLRVVITCRLTSTAAIPKDNTQRISPVTE